MQETESPGEVTGSGAGAGPPEEESRVARFRVDRVRRRTAGDAAVSLRMATTQWSQVVAARDGGDTEARCALETLCRTYWQPLYAYIRHQGSDPDEARDLTQAYFTEFLEKDFLADVDRSKGKFRSFLFASLRHVLAHQRDRSWALKRGGGAHQFPLDIAVAERGYAHRPAEQMTPEDLFEHRWAMTVLAGALERVRGQWQDAGNARQYELLRPYLTSGGNQAPYRETAAALGVSEGAVKVAVHRLRKRFGQCLRDEIAETVAGPADIEDELRHLLTVLGR